MFRVTQPSLRPQRIIRMNSCAVTIPVHEMLVDGIRLEMVDNGQGLNMINSSPPSACELDRPTAATLRHRSIVSQVSGPPIPASTRILTHPAGVHVLLPCLLGTSPGNPVPAHRIVGPLPVHGQPFALTVPQGVDERLR